MDIKQRIQVLLMELNNDAIVERILNDILKIQLDLNKTINEEDYTIILGMRFFLKLNRSFANDFCTWIRGMDKSIYSLIEAKDYLKLVLLKIFNTILNNDIELSYDGRFIFELKKDCNIILTRGCVIEIENEE